MGQVACPLEVLAAQCRGLRNQPVVHPSLPAPLVPHATLPARRYKHGQFRFHSRARKECPEFAKEPDQHVRDAA